MTRLKEDGSNLTLTVLATFFHVILFNSHVCCYLFLTPQKINTKKKYKNTKGYTWEKPRRLLKLMVKDQNDKWKVEGPECTRLVKLVTQF